MPFKPSTLNAVMAHDPEILVKQLLEQAIETTIANKNHNLAYFSTSIKLSEFYKITNSNPEQVVYDFPDGNENKDSEKACFSILKSSIFFFDLPDKSLFREENGKLDIQHILSSVKTLKKDYNLKTVVIDNIDAIACTLMGREALWRTNAGNLNAFEDWKERRLEYLMALLFYISRKFDVSLIFGKKTTTQIEEVNLKQLFPYNTFEMIDAFNLLNEKHRF